MSCEIAETVRETLDYMVAYTVADAEVVTSHKRDYPILKFNCRGDVWYGKRDDKNALEQRDIDHYWNQFYEDIEKTAKQFDEAWNQCQEDIQKTPKRKSSDDCDDKVDSAVEGCPKKATTKRSKGKGVSTM